MKVISQNSQLLLFTLAIAAWAAISSALFSQMPPNWPNVTGVPNSGYCCRDNGDTGCCPEASVCETWTKPQACGASTYLSANADVGRQWGVCEAQQTWTCTSYSPWYCCRMTCWSTTACNVGAITCYRFTGFNGGCNTNVLNEKCN